ncbi:uncharacterized protein LOC111393844 isoform X2 [Olea europaea var. sylvestris]|uniref:uncharacterized protein LOC111393844 isoform X2 n=1 Tax=Olea europaea var. sylvestris TaxID=158386 RepID=UPI000C1D8812|nr:uncharacterized protein LOC111393844 isoform X2 [Olea europaea var. sylvestris]
MLNLFYFRLRTLFSFMGFELEFVHFVYSSIKMPKRNIFHYFKKDDDDGSSGKPNAPHDSPTSNPRSPPKNKRAKPENEFSFESNCSCYERDPGKRIPIWQYPANKQDEVRRAYVDMGPYQPIYDYPFVSFGTKKRRFQSSWFTKFSWLEFSIENGSAFCFPCYLFDSNTSKSEAFTVKGFQNWKKVNCDSKCPLKTHEGGCNSSHSIAVQKLKDLKNPSQHMHSSKENMLTTGVILKQVKIFSNSDFVEYSKLTHDSNPLHFNLERAKNAGFADLPVPGMLVASLFPRIIASHIPGAVYVNQTLEFKSPVYSGEEITGEVQALNIIRQMEEKYMLGEIHYKMLQSWRNYCD